MRVSSGFRVGLLTLASVLLVLSLTLVGYIAHLRRAAGNLRDDLTLLISKESTYEDAERVASKYRRFRVRGRFHVWRDDKDFIIRPEDACTQAKCLMDFEIRSALLERLHLTRPSEFRASVIVLDNRIAYVEMVLSGGFGAGIVDYVHCCAGMSSFFDIDSRGAYSFPTPIGKKYLSVVFTNLASPEQKRRAVGLNMRCFLSRKRCDWPCDYLPLAWTDYERGVPQEDLTLWKQEGMNCPNDE